MLDADFNELVELIDRRLRTETIDIIGHCIVPSETPDGFLIGLSGRRDHHRPGPDICRRPAGREPRRRPGRMERLARGAARHDGRRVRRPAIPARRREPAAGTQGRRTVPGLRRRLEARGHADRGRRPRREGGRGRHRDPDPDRLAGQGLPAAGQPGRVEGPVSCDTPDDAIPGWLDFIAPSAGRLTTEGQGVASVDDPCVIPPDGGYRGSENRLYRVEIHDPGGLGVATFKWSRDNASIATTVEAMDASRTELTVTRTARDAVLRFSTGDWVELTDDRHELYGRPGVMRKVGPVDDVALTLTLTTALPAGEFDPTDPERHTRIKRWDQKGIVRDATQTAVDDVDANGGVIKVPGGGTTLIVEDGIQVTLSVDPAGGDFRTGDYWVFAARTVDASVDELVEAPPRGHPPPLLPAGDPRVRPGAGGLSDHLAAAVRVRGRRRLRMRRLCQRRVPWVRDTSRSRTPIKQVIDAGGGTVCIGPGRYPTQTGCLDRWRPVRPRPGGRHRDGARARGRRPRAIDHQLHRRPGPRPDDHRSTTRGGGPERGRGRRLNAHRARATDRPGGPGRVGRVHPEGRRHETARRRHLARRCDRRAARSPSACWSPGPASAACHPGRETNGPS